VFADTSEDLEGVGNCIHIDSSNELYAGYHTLVARCLDESMYKVLRIFVFDR
jgi:type I restriction enzyme S subunit